MPFLKLGKTAKKAWKNLTKKLHTKLLHKLNRSKTIKKPTRRLKTSSKANPWTSLAFKPRLKAKNQTIQSTRILRDYHHHHHRSQKRPPPVCIDDLLEPPVSEVEHHLQLPSTITNHKGEMREISLLNTEEAKLSHQFADDVAGTSGETVERRDEIYAADDMWESIGLASPLMHGINERAEEFITRIRGEMQLQEMMARRL